MITAIALDDEPPALEIIERYCDKIAAVDLKKTFTSVGETFEYLDKYPVDLILLDINMPAVNGITFYKRLHNQMMVIFTTSYSEYAAESYDLRAIDYLVKPYSFKRFSQAIDRASEFHQLRQAAPGSSAAHLTLRVDYGLVKVPLSEILFIEGLDNYIKIHIADKPPVVVRMTMKAMLEKLPSPPFARVHRSFIIPISQVTAVRNRLIFLQCGEEIPLGNLFEEAFMRIVGK